MNNKKAVGRRTFNYGEDQMIAREGKRGGETGH